MNKKIALSMLGIALIALVIASYTLLSMQGKVIARSEVLNVGAVLPLTGAASSWGKQIQNGMEVAKDELSAEGQQVRIIYEDSQANPQQGIIAYNKLAKVDKVNIIFSAFSRVSVPLVALSKEDKMPLIMTIVYAKNVTAGSEYAFRFYSYEKQYVEPHFKYIVKSRYPEVAILFINDDFGTSVREAVRNKLDSSGIKIVADESFAPNSADMRTQLSKIKEKNPKAVIFIGSVPIEVSSALKQMQELNIKADFIEASAALAQEAARVAAGEAGEGAYTIAFPFTLGMNGNAFKDKYKAEFKEELNFAAAFGYDLLMLSARADKERGLTGKELADEIKNVQNYKSLNGNVKIMKNGEINPETYAARVVNGGLVKV